MEKESKTWKNLKTFVDSNCNWATFFIGIVLKKIIPFTRATSKIQHLTLVELQSLTILEFGKTFGYLPFKSTQEQNKERKKERREHFILEWDTTRTKVTVYKLAT